MDQRSGRLILWAIYRFLLSIAALSRRWLYYLLINIGLVGNLHPHLFIKPQCASGAVGIDMEMDSANISSPEFSQGMVQGASLIQVAVD
ncbi:MAG: hypothetical protein NT075_08320 [Chloroflexi bacterium]|nr:hypothetical protein [Chloroflexota bacterium]